MCPDVNYLVVTFIICNEPHAVVIENLFNLFVTLRYKFCLFFRYDNIIEVEGETSLECCVETEVLYCIKEISCFSCSCKFKNTADNIPQGFLCKKFIYISYLTWNNLVEDNTTDSCFNKMIYKFSILAVINLNLNECMKVNFTFIVCYCNLFRRIEYKPFAPYFVLFGALSSFCYVVKAKNHVL